MTTATVNQQSVKLPARRMARTAGVLFVINIVTAMYAYFGPGNRPAFWSRMVAAVAQVTVTVLLYHLFRPSGRRSPNCFTPMT